MKDANRLKKGFTLLEMLVVIGIIAILAGASMLGYSKIVKSAKKAKTQELVSNAATALTHVLSKCDGVWPEDLLLRVSGGNGLLDADTAKIFIRFNLLGLSYNQQSAKGDVSQYRLTGKDRCGVVDADAFERLSCSAVGTDERTVVPSRKGGRAREVLSADRTGLCDMDYL